MQIKFGTSGWRGIIGREFTFEKVEAIVDAIGVLLREQGFENVIIGGDTRFLSPEMAEHTATRLAGYGFCAFLADKPVPTPVLSFAVRQGNFGGAINFTASHNPALYNGIKFSPSHGGPAEQEITRRIENLVAERKKPRSVSGKVITTNFIDDYEKQIRKLIDFEVIKSQPLKIVYDPFFGTGLNLLDRLLRQSGAAVRTIHNRRDPLFGGKRPEPDGKYLQDLSEEVRRSGADLGLSTDGDGDRFGIVDSSGRFVSPHEFLPLLLDYLVREKGWKGAAVRSLSTGSMFDRVGRRHNLEVIETPVGFKHLGAVMLERDVVLAGEESGGLSVLGHVPEKDGILACLLAAEMTARTGTDPGKMLEEFRKEYGRLYNVRSDIELTGKTREKIIYSFFDNIPESINGEAVVDRDLRDGVKLFLDDETWVLIRLSGTEPLARVLVQACSEEKASQLIHDVRRKFEG